MTNFEKLFGNAAYAAETLTNIKCLDPDYESCEGCPFYNSGVQCPQYNNKFGNALPQDVKTITEWLMEEE